MSPEIIFDLHLVLGYVAWLLCTAAYVLPKLKTMNSVDAQRSIAALHSFRFFGLVFILPGVVGHNLPPGFAPFAAYGDFATGVLAMLALFTVRIRSLFWFFVVAFNVVGVVDILVDYYHGVKYGLGALSGDLGGAYPIVTIYVPLLIITHFVAFRLMLRSESKASRAVAHDAVAS